MPGSVGTHSRVWVYWTAINIQIFLRKHLRAFINCSSRSIKDPSKHVFRDTKFETVTSELDFGLI